MKTIKLKSLALVFQFTHPRGVRPAHAPMCTAKRCFNSRTHAGCDHYFPRLSADDQFQFTHPRGVRQIVEFPSSTATMFQFTHPRGVRPVASACALTLRSFNSRTHAGCDIPGLDNILRAIEVSIHAPTRGATRPSNLYFHKKQCFNSRTHAGCDISFDFGLRNPGCFNSRTHAGCDGPYWDF